MDLSVSGRADGLMASSASGFFDLFDGSITAEISRALGPLETCEKPFEMLGIFIDAKAPEYERSTKKNDELLIREVRELRRFRTGESLKVFEILLTTTTFYSCSISGKKSRAVEAFRSIAGKLEATYGSAVADVATAVRNAAQKFLLERNDEVLANRLQEFDASTRRLIEPPSM